MGKNIGKNISKNLKKKTEEATGYLIGKKFPDTASSHTTVELRKL